MDLNIKIIFLDSVFAQEIDEEMVILDKDSENYFGLDEVGKVMWQEMQDKKILKDVFDSLVDIYDVQEDILKKDLQEFVNSLVDSKLIEVEKI